VQKDSRQGLNFHPSISDIAAMPTVTDFIVSGFLRASKTFQIYEAVIAKLGIEGEYLPLEIARVEGRPDAGSFKDYLDVARNNPKVRSLVISDPYKQIAFSICHKLDDRAKLCGAVNLILLENGELRGLNIDGEAFLRGMSNSLEGFNPQRGVIFGCGGVSTAVASILASRLKSVALVEVDPPRATKLADLMARVNPDLDCSIVLRPNSADFREYDFFYNGTGLGKKSNDPNFDSQSPIIRGDRFPTAGVAVDANYTPSSPLFLRQMEELGLSTVNGRSHMLGFVSLHLSIISGIQVDFDLVRNAADAIVDNPSSLS
jgi:shikimate dehydrogenase